MFRDQESEYIGEWVRGQKHGIGEEKWWKDNTSYVGYHADGKKHGKYYTLIISVSKNIYKKF